jgi:hypothetical protein
LLLAVTSSTAAAAAMTTNRLESKPDIRCTCPP